MSRSSTPWIGLLALVAMFVLPRLPDWLFEGRRTIKHWPPRHICGDCGAAWTDGHTCAPDATATELPPLRGELQRLEQPVSDGGTALVPKTVR